MKKELKVGERVAFYHNGLRWFGSVYSAPREDGAMRVDLDRSSIERLGLEEDNRAVPEQVQWVNAKQCRRLRRRERSEKRERVERAVRYIAKSVPEGDFSCIADPTEQGALCGRGIGWEPVRFVELRAGEAVVSRADLARAWDYAHGTIPGSAINSTNFARFSAAALGPEESK